MSLSANRFAILAASSSSSSAKQRTRTSGKQASSLSFAGASSDSSPPAPSAVHATSAHSTATSIPSSTAPTGNRAALKSAPTPAAAHDGFAPTPECRICQCGPEEGRMISPCKCKGSMKFVHAECLQKWRELSSNRKSFFQCEQCLYKYSFRRTGAANILRNPLVLLLATCLAFFMCTIVAGYAVKFLFFVFDWDRDYSPDSWFALDLQHFMLGAVGVSGFGFITLAPAMLNARPFGGELNGDSKVCNIVIVVVLVVGAIRTLYLIYRKIVEATEGVLTTMEDAIENVA